MQQSIQIFIRSNWNKEFIGKLLVIVVAIFENKIGYKIYLSSC